MFFREKSKIEFSFGFFGENVDFHTFQIPMKSGYEHDTLDGAPDLTDEEVLQEVPDISCYNIEKETDIDYEIASRQKGILNRFIPTKLDVAKYL